MKAHFSCDNHRRLAQRVLLTALFLLALPTGASTHESLLKPYGAPAKSTKHDQARAKREPVAKAKVKEEVSFAKRVEAALTPNSFEGWCTVIGVFVVAVFAGIRILIDIEERREARIIASLPRSALITSESTLCNIQLAPDKREIFSPFPTNRHRLYRLRLSGCCMITERTTKSDGTVSEHRCCIDGRFRRDSNDNFTMPHSDPENGLYIDGKPLSSIPHEVTLVDREAHVYEIVFDGTGRKVGFAFWMNAYLYDRRFDIQFSEYPDTTPTLAGRAALAAERKAAEELAEAVEAMSTLTGLDRNWADPAFVEASAKTGGRQLLASRPDLQKRLNEFHENKKLMANLREHHPELLRRLTGPIDGYLMAQRIAVTPPPPPPAPKLRKKKTPAEVRAYLVRGAEMVAEDERAILETVATAYERNRQTLLGKGLDEDEILNILGSLADVLAEAKERIAARKGAGDVQVAKVG